VPILVSDPSPENTQALAAAIAKHLKGRSAVVIASTDMSHYYTDEVARTMDARMIELLKKQDSAGIFEANHTHEGELCGEAAVLTILQYAKLQGKTTYELLNYSNSSDSTGDKSRVVGYGAGVIWAGSRNAASGTAASGLSPEQKKQLLQLARESVEGTVRGQALPRWRLADPVFQERRAVFVTLKKNGQLRGCIGRLEAEEPLADAVRHMAVEAATRDPRFSPVKTEELKDLHYEISVLSVPARVKSADDIEMGKHGVLVRNGDHGGVFLPKVAEMFDWDKTMFLNELCSQKAHLPSDCWKDPGTEIEVFTADEFAGAS
jgi:AmmeMemoRadiSam system protein A